MLLADCRAEFDEVTELQGISASYRESIFRRKRPPATNEASANPSFRTEAAMEPSSDVIVIFGSILGLFLLAILIMGGWNAHSAALRAEKDAAFKKHMLARGFSAEEIEGLLRASAELPKESAKIAEEEADSLRELARLLGCCEPDAKPEAIEEILAIARTADEKTRRAMVRAVTELRENSRPITVEQIRAVVRALAHPAGPSTSAIKPGEALPPRTGAAPRITDAFHLPD